MTRFPNDSLDAALCHGDASLQICANTQDTVIHALRDIIKHTPDLLSVRWKRKGLFPITRREKAKRRRSICWVSKTALPIPIARMIS
ncbi:Dyp-type peroxidase domain-containing protein [Escherichia coli]